LRRDNPEGTSSASPQPVHVTGADDVRDKWRQIKISPRAQTEDR
jgi:hypothetical protein